jgi:prepilin-type N-terminal cleavage/methylation domain-containing protein
MRRTARNAYTLLELIIVLAVILILGAGISLTFDGYYGNTRQKAAADGIRARLADARAKAMQQGTWYRLAISTDGRCIRLAPDGPDFATLPADNPPSFDSKVTEDQFEEGVTAEVIDVSDDQAQLDSGGWRTIATVGPEGICKEDGALIRVREKNFAPIDVRVRGVIGSARIVRPQSQQSGGQQ